MLLHVFFSGNVLNAKLELKCQSIYVVCCLAQREASAGGDFYEIIDLHG